MILYTVIQYIRYYRKRYYYYDIIVYQNSQHDINFKKEKIPIIVVQQKKERALKIQ
jgi:hypothetical protein